MRLRVMHSESGIARSRYEKGERLMAGDEKLRCSFCDRDEDEVTWLLAGGAQSVYICGECVDACVKIIDREKARGSTSPRTS